MEQNRPSAETNIEDVKQAKKQIQHDKAARDIEKLHQKYAQSAQITSP